MTWLVLTYRVPSEPSRHRVAVWRELRKAGAIALGQATWAVPALDDLRLAFGRVVKLVERSGGEAFCFEVDPDADTRQRLETSFVEAREAEWVEFCAECAKFHVEIDKEFAKAKFTLAELDEEDQNLERLRRWFRELKARDVFGAPAATTAATQLEDCATHLDEYAERVYQERGQS